METEREATGSKFAIDPIHEELDVYHSDQVLTLDVWRSKYHFGDEGHPFDSCRRVVEGVYAKDPSKDEKHNALEAMQKNLWIPAGRIQAGAGTPNIVTLLNCYMCQEIDDSMSGIADALRDAMLTMQQGGGIGMNFSSLRPSGAYLRRTAAVASGPLPFMEMWDSMCKTIMSAGSRRGAMMAVMSDEHPDLIDFIKAKQQPGHLTNFNVSVLISDAFMDAVKEDEEWFLGFNVPRADGKHLFVTEREIGGDVEHWYAYSRWKARDLWDLIIRNTYEWSEPGVIFIDRVNRRNNLRYCETITGTNPCGEQPLPPNGCCNLGAVNLARMVTKPFTPQATFDYYLLMDIVKVGTRFLDNVIDISIYPLETQAKEEYAKRRLGIGITGLANCLAQLGLRYGSEEAVKMTDTIMDMVKQVAYLTSAELAKERGPFPLYDPDEWGKHSPVVKSLQSECRGAIAEHGIRNGVLLTIAPTGTTSLYAGNVSSGLEPVFLHKAIRNVRQADNTFKPYTIYDYGYRMYCHQLRVNPESQPRLPDYMATHETISVMEHLQMQAVCQKHVDASVSKTINCPRDISFEDFEGLYQSAYVLGCKGATSYRFSETRGSILSSASAEAEGPESRPHQITERPNVLHGATYKIKWPSVNENYYITINDINNEPFEVFIQSTSSKYTDWTTALGLMISAIMRKGGDISFIPTELAKVRSADDTGWVDGKHYGSLVALIGDTIGRHLSNGIVIEVEAIPIEASEDPQAIGEICPQCNQPSLIEQEGCMKCMNCTYSKCG